MNIQESLGVVLKEIRTERNISQEQFALSIDMDRTYYSSVESGKRNISLQNLLKIANGFNIPLSHIFILIEKIEGGKNNV